MEKTDIQEMIEQINVDIGKQIEMLEGRINENFNEKIKMFENRIDDSILDLSNKMKTFEYQLNILGNRTEATMTQVGLSEALSAASAIGASPRYINPSYMR